MRRLLLLALALTACDPGELTLTCTYEGPDGPVVTSDGMLDCDVWCDAPDQLHASVLESCEADAPDTADPSCTCVVEPNDTCTQWLRAHDCGND